VPLAKGSAAAAANEPNRTNCHMVSEWKLQPQARQTVQGDVYDGQSKKPLKDIPGHCRRNGRAMGQFDLTNEKYISNKGTPINQEDNI
jgi:hypothetical protein